VKLKIIKVVSLYLTILVISAVVISTHLHVSMWAALGTAAIGCIVKTLAAWVHGELFAYLEKKQRGTKHGKCKVCLSGEARAA